MKEINLKVTLDKAREWYNSGNETLREIALQAFSENELKFDFRNIKSLGDACKVLNLNYDEIIVKSCRVKDISKSAAALFKLSVIRKALNLGQYLHLTKNPKDSYIYYPYNPFADESSNYVNEFNANKPSKKLKIIGKIKHKGVLYNVLGGATILSSGKGVACFCSGSKVGYGYFDSGFLGCATEEVAEHFGRHFGMLITEAKYGDLEDFEIVHSC